MKDLGKWNGIGSARIDFSVSRQSAIMLREAVKFRIELEHQNWPCILSGGKFHRISSTCE